MIGRREMAGAALAGVLALAALGTGCGGGSDENGANKPAPPAKPQDFPKAAGKSIVQLRAQLSGEGPVLAPSVSQLSPGRNRFGFGLFDRARAQITDAPVAVYIGRAGGGPARGPFLARYESLAVKPAFQSRTVASDPDAAKSLYVTELRFPKPGRYDVLGIVRLDDRLVAATASSAGVTVTTGSPVPGVGDRAPRIHTPTKAQVGGAVQKIDTRQPPSTMHAADFAAVLGKKPAVLIFATPALCQSRVCGPVVDVAEQVKADRGDDATFIHQEIYRNNQVDQGFRPQVLAWKLPTEPWLFAIDRHGRIAARIEGAFSAGELERAVDAATRR